MNPKDLRDLVPPELLGEDSRLVEILELLPQQACADLVDQIKLVFDQA